MLFIGSVWRYEEADGFADHLIGFITEYSLSALVPASDDAIQILGDDGILRGLYHRRELSKTELRIASEVDFDKQEINGSVKCSDRTHQQETDDNEGNQRD